MWCYLKVRTTCTKALIKFQFSLVAQSCLTLCDPMNCTRQASLSITNSRSSLKLTSIESVMPSSHLILCPPLLLLLPIPPSIRVFSNESTLYMRWPKYWSFCFSISPSKEIPGLISFRMDWLDLLVVQGTLKSLLQQHSSKASVLWRSTYFKLLLQMKKKKKNPLIWKDPHTHNGILLSHKKEWTFAIFKNMDWLEGIMLTEICEREEDKCCIIPFIWRIKQ